MKALANKLGFEFIPDNKQTHLDERLLERVKDSLLKDKSWGSVEHALKGQIIGLETYLFDVVSYARPARRARPRFQTAP